MVTSSSEDITWLLNLATRDSTALVDVPDNYFGEGMCAKDFRGGWLPGQRNSLQCKVKQLVSCSECVSVYVHALSQDVEAMPSSVLYVYAGLSLRR